MTNHYETLGVAFIAKHEEIANAYRALAWQHHPDRGGDADVISRINEAWSILKETKKRNMYNKELIQTHTNCTNCKGEGVTYKQKGFTERKLTPCKTCNGVGIRRKV